MSVLKDIPLVLAGSVAKNCQAADVRLDEV